ncbi:VOC family protein [Halobacillus salinus]|uniref:VOC family protein n=1 Tax=Halobacillus salinus TaxID=192814 RepID=UPI001116DB78|nr:VOC family protein [Halobacillus salinus]
MFTKVGQIMLYVDNQDEAELFWTEKLGFVVTAREEMEGMKWIEVAPQEGAETTIVLHDKEVVSKMSPEVNLGTPSLMFYTKDFDQLHSDLKNKEITVGEIVGMPSGRVFNFADNENNYFAVMDQGE